MQADLTIQRQDFIGGDPDLWAELIIQTVIKRNDRVQTIVTTTQLHDNETARSRNTGMRLHRLGGLRRWRADDRFRLS